MLCAEILKLNVICHVVWNNLHFARCWENIKMVTFIEEQLGHEPLWQACIFAVV